MYGRASHRLPKEERLNSLLLIRKLFGGGARSVPMFPLRVVCMPVDKAGLPTVSVLVSVSKKRFKRAVDRNRVKRQIREAYRKNRMLLAGPLGARGKKAVVAFIWLDDGLHPSSEVEEKVKRLLQLIAERMT